jgi:cytochrome c-type biogenesis protein CcmF
MNLGDLLLRIALLLTIPAAILFLRDLRGRAVPAAAGWLFGLHSLAVGAALALLWSLFLGHRFEYAYVAEYSSRALPPALSFAASWAGQEGSILLWVVLLAGVGLALLRQPGSLTRSAMFFLTLIQMSLLALLLAHSPFRLSSIRPDDGLGLNPLLEDPWMVVHPPVLFAGYAVMAAPFALAAAALVRGEARAWQRAVWPWTLMAVVTLGAGIALGGIWAYKVLGWGGYWGWDPVENASLVPWLVAVALLHGLFIQRTTGALARTNVLLAMLGWLTVLGGTYLTRSGVLQNFSVHSFAASGLGPPLGIVLGTTFLVSVILLARGWRALEARPLHAASVSREFALWIGLLTVLVFAALVVFGTTAPLLTAWVGHPANVRAGFYEAISVPLGVLIVLVMAIAPALRWSRQAGLDWLKALVPGLAGGLLTIAVALASGIRAPSHLLLLGTTAFALIVNAWMMWRLFRRGWSYGAGYLGHAGLSVMILGMVMSTALGRTERLTLEPDVPRRSLGYTLTYRGETPDGSGGSKLTVDIEARGWRLRAAPQMLDLPRGEGSMHKPAISVLREIYLSPLELRKESVGPGGLIWLSRGRPVVASGATLVFTGFRMESHEGMRVRADIDVRHGGRSWRVAPGVFSDSAGRHSVPVRAGDLGEISIGRIDADNKRVGVLLSGTPVTSLAVVDFSTKPLVNLVWVGALLTLLGAILAGIRRAIEASTAPRTTRSAAPMSGSRTPDAGA